MCRNMRERRGLGKTVNREAGLRMARKRWRMSMHSWPEAVVADTCFPLWQWPMNCVNGAGK